MEQSGVMVARVVGHDDHALLGRTVSEQRFEELLEGFGIEDRTEGADLEVAFVQNSTVHPRGVLPDGAVSSIAATFSGSDWAT
jgi:hypothetical protein